MLVDALKIHAENTADIGHGGQIFARQRDPTPVQRRGLRHGDHLRARIACIDEFTAPLADEVGRSRDRWRTVPNGDDIGRGRAEIDDKRLPSMLPDEFGRRQEIHGADGLGLHSRRLAAREPSTPLIRGGSLIVTGLVAKRLVERRDDPVNPLGTAIEKVGQLPGHGHRDTTGAGEQRHGSAKRPREVIETFPQRAGELCRSHKLPILEPGDLEMRAANVQTDHDRHAMCCSEFIQSGRRYSEEFVVRVIPVLDLLGGAVVAARGGQRQSYRPIASPLCPGTSDPLCVAAALTALSDTFDWLYIADLDAIQGRPPQREIVRTLSASLLRHRIYLDEGRAFLEAPGFWARHPMVSPVIGSESLRGIAELRAALGAVPQPCALSLDWKENGPLGPPEVYAEPAAWPQRIFVMTLDRIGASAGPDLDRIARVQSQSKAGAMIYAAGGVRDATDLMALQKMGCAGALVSTALHAGTIGRADLDRLARD